MRFRRLKISLQTTDGTYGTTLEFPDGLVVIWADNSMGKSTCVRAMLVALGMEAILGTSQQELPLPPAMRTKIYGAEGEHIVIESEVFLEIENNSGERVVVQRTIKGQRDKNLISVHRGPALTYPSASYEVDDYFVSRAGAATREHGFHRFLSSFLGWDIPEVQTYDGGDVPLYLQCIFPYFVVEQMRGWSTVTPPLPTQFRIREAHKRVIEFLLNLDAHKIAQARQSFQSQKRKLEGQWTAQISRAEEIAEIIGGAIRAIPKQPISQWPPEFSPSLIVPSEDKWMTIEERAERNAEKLNVLLEQDLPRVAEVVKQNEGNLADLETALVSKQTLINRVLQAFESEEQEVFQARERLSAIEEDIQRNKDVRTLKNLGSRRDSVLAHGECPMCHQSIADSLIPLPAEQSVMTLDENIEFLSEQRRTFAGLLASSERVVRARRLQLKSLRDETSGIRERIRRLRQTLVSDGRLPSIDAIHARIDLENKIKQDRDLAAQIENVIAGFAPIAESWAELQKSLALLPSDDITHDDIAKIDRWKQLLVEQLGLYGFKSIEPDKVSISHDTYRPEHEGFDVQTSISASDLIRTIWSYLNGLLEFARDSETNHPGTILFDEPRQQSTRDVSFAAFLERASAAAQYGQQVIFFTSEAKDRLLSHLKEIPHKLELIEGRVLSRTSAQRLRNA
jgi:hypothetical protein